MGRTGTGNFHRFGKRVIFLLSQKVNRATIAQQGHIGPTIAVQIPDRQGIGIHATILQMPAFGLAPPVGAQVVADDQILGVAKINEIRPPITVQIRNRQCGNAFLRRQ